MRRSLLLFDLDGTLLLTGGAGTRSFERSFLKHYGVTINTQGVRMDGKTDPAIARELLSLYGLPSDDPAVEKILSGYVEALESEVAASPGYHVLQDVEEALKELSQRKDVVIGLATGNLEAGARIKLERGNLNQFFPFGGFGSDSEDRTEIVRIAVRRGKEYAKEDFGPADIVVIGDTPRDVDAGKAAGVKVLAVASGSFDLEALRACFPDAVVKSLSNPSDWLTSLFGK